MSSRDRAIAMAKRCGLALFAVILGEATLELVQRSAFVPNGHPMQTVRICAASIAVLGAWRALRGLPLAPREDAPRVLVETSWVVRGLGVLAVAQLVMTVDCGLLAPQAWFFSAIAHGRLPWWFEHLGTLLINVETWFVLALLVLPLRAGAVARHALATGDPAKLRVLLLPTAAACAVTGLVLLLDHTWRGILLGDDGFGFGRLAMRLNPVSFAFHSQKVRVPLGCIELVASALLVISWFRLRRVAAPATAEPLVVESASDEPAELFLGDID